MTNASGGQDLVANAWLKLIDASDSSAAWGQASTRFRDHISQAEWDDRLAQARQPLGKLKARKLISSDSKSELPGAPPGDYVVIAFQSLFETGGELGERLTIMKDADGQFRVAGYYLVANPGD
ncbi:MAG: DUF4019 domain-containing protein [Burkholderiaceae bacterium]